MDEDCFVYELCRLHLWHGICGARVVGTHNWLTTGGAHDCAPTIARQINSKRGVHLAPISLD